MATAEESPCPACGTPEALVASWQLVAEPIGSFSLSGVMMKVPVRNRPVLTCRVCPLWFPGETDGRHVYFPRPVVA